jgi:hypothetical protein
MNRNPNRLPSLFLSIAALAAVAAPSRTFLFAAGAQAPPDQTAPAKKPAAKKPAQPAKPDQSSTAPADETQSTDEPRPSTTQRSFTDDDLQKYHKPKPAPEDAEAGAAETDAAPASGAATPATVKPAVSKSAGSKPVPAKAAAKKPKPNVVTPPDPAQLALAKSALDAARAKELKARRDRIDALEGRLQYLHAKRDAILNPTGAQVGSTGPRAFQYDQNGKPVLDPSTGKPVTRPDISPGHGNAPVGPMFVPLPEAQTDDDRDKDKTMKVKDLLASVEAEIKSVEADLESAKAELIDYETRFAPPAGAP